MGGRRGGGRRCSTGPGPVGEGLCGDAVYEWEAEDIRQTARLNDGDDDGGDDDDGGGDDDH